MADPTRVASVVLAEILAAGTLEFGVFFAELLARAKLEMGAGIPSLGSTARPAVAALTGITQPRSRPAVPAGPPTPANLPARRGLHSSQVSLPASGPHARQNQPCSRRGLSGPGPH